MRRIINAQTGLDFQPDCLPETQRYYEKYERIDQILRENRGVLKLVHKDLEAALESKSGRRSRYSSNQVLRIAIVQAIEGESLRDVTIRVDESAFLREFTRIYNDKMMSFTTFCSLRNRIMPETWHAVNLRLAKSAVKAGLVHGDKLRVDTTAVETNIHWPTDSTLLWDTCRKCASLIRAARELEPDIDGGRRLQDNRAKKLCQKITRILSNKAKPGQKPEKLEKARKHYSELISVTSSLLAIATNVAAQRIRSNGTETALSDDIKHFIDLGHRVVDQAKRRVLEGEKVPATEKVYSIFESHTELIKRGKAGKAIEFGHMILLDQVEGCFVTNYEVFDKKPDESLLLPEIVKRHEKLFGSPPRVLAADKGFYSSMEDLYALEEKVAMVSVCKKGRRNPQEERREREPEFKLAQKFRAGVEGSISVLKRCFGLFRCLRKGWSNFSSMVGNAIFAHNLCVLARGFP